MPKTAYTFFQLSVRDENWKEVEAQHDATSCSREVISRRVAKLTGQKWRLLNHEEREPFRNLCEDARREYFGKLAVVTAACSETTDCQKADGLTDNQKTE